MHFPLTLASPPDYVAAIAVGGGLLCGIIGIIVGHLNRRHEISEREQSRREIAAYVAEGTISPDQAERLLAAGRRPKKNPEA